MSDDCIFGLGQLIPTLVDVVYHMTIVASSDVNPDPVGSAFNLVRESGSRGIKLKEKHSLTNRSFGGFL